MRSPHRCGAQAVVDLGAVGDQPAADHRLGEPRAILAGGGGGEVAKPGEALQLLGHRARRRRARRSRGRRARRLAADAGSAPARMALPRWRSPCTWSRGTAASLSGCARALQRARASEPRASFGQRRDRAAEPSLAHPLAAKRLDVGGISAGPAAEGGGAGDEHVGAGVDRRARGVGVDAAVDLEVDSSLALAMRLAIASIFLQLAVDEALPAEARD